MLFDYEKIFKFFKELNKLTGNIYYCGLDNGDTIYIINSATGDYEVFDYSLIIRYANNVQEFIDKVL